jgi:hypothetical protein
MSSATVTMSTPSRVSSVPNVWRRTLCVPKTSSESCDQAIFVDQGTGASLFSDAVLAGVDRLG